MPAADPPCLQTCRRTLAAANVVWQYHVTCCITCCKDALEVAECGGAGAWCWKPLVAALRLPHWWVPAVHAAMQLEAEACICVIVLAWQPQCCLCVLQQLGTGPMWCRTQQRTAAACSFQQQPLSTKHMFHCELEEDSASINITHVNPHTCLWRRHPRPTSAAHQRYCLAGQSPPLHT
jgi:hypothetical protein